MDVETQQNVIRRREEHTATGVRWSAVLAALAVLILIVVVVALFATHVI